MKRGTLIGLLGGTAVFITAGTVWALSQRKKREARNAASAAQVKAAVAAGAQPPVQPPEPAKTFLEKLVEKMVDAPSAKQKEVTKVREAQFFYQEAQSACSAAEALLEAKEEFTPWFALTDSREKARTRDILDEAYWDAYGACNAQAVPNEKSMQYWRNLIQAGRDQESSAAVFAVFNSSVDHALHGRQVGGFGRLGGRRVGLGNYLMVRGR